MITNKGIVVLLVAFLLVFSLGIFVTTRETAHAEGATFINVFRQAGDNGVYITYVATQATNNTGWIILTDIGSDFVCGKGGGKLVCVPLDKIVSITIDNVDSLPGGGS